MLSFQAVCECVCDYKEVLKLISYKPLVGSSSNLQPTCSLETKVRWLDCEVKTSKVEVTTRLSIVRNHVFKKCTFPREGIAVICFRVYMHFNYLHMFFWSVYSVIG